MTYITSRLDLLNPEYKEPLRTHPNPRRVPRQNPGFEPIPRRSNPELVDQDERTMRCVRLGALTFDGYLDPKFYIDWEGDMDQ